MRNNNNARMNTEYAVHDVRGLSLHSRRIIIIIIIRCPDLYRWILRCAQYIDFVLIIFLQE